MPGRRHQPLGFGRSPGRLEYRAWNIPRPAFARDRQRTECMTQLLQRVNLLINLSHLACRKTLSGMSVANPVQSQQDRDLSQAESRLLRSLHALQALQCFCPVVRKASEGSRRLWQ
jgi:hypothetical protein